MQREREREKRRVPGKFRLTFVTLKRARALGKEKKASQESRGRKGRGNSKRTPTQRVVVRRESNRKETRERKGTRVKCRVYICIHTHIHAEKRKRKFFAKRKAREGGREEKNKTTGEERSVARGLKGSPFI